MSPGRDPSKFQRVGSDREPMRVPTQIADGGYVVIDAAWGTITPLQLADGVKTVGELELIAHLEAGLPLVDTRPPEVFAGGTVPGASNLPHADTSERMDELDRDRPTVFFCNGPQCGATPDAIETLLEADYPPSSILYYRGGIHDWVSLGLPTE